jgi:glycosyltransferase involved in cell wall biosynthesis
MTDDSVLKPENNREPLVSVLVPAYNHGKYIVECLESTKSLAHKRLELIVSDDCSTDDTFALADQWAQRNAARFERTVVTRQKQNVGIVENLQFLFNNAHGDYLVYIASDDVFVESSISDRLRVLEADETIDAVLGDSQSISNSGALLKEQRAEKRAIKSLASRKLLTAALLRYWGTPGPSLMIRRRAVLKDGSLGYLPQDLKFEDRYIYIRLAALHKLCYVDSIVMKYREVANSMSRGCGFSEINSRGVLTSDRYNRVLLGKAERLYLDVLDSLIEKRARRSHRLFLRLRINVLRVIGLLLWRILELRALLSVW